MNLRFLFCILASFFLLIPTVSAQELGEGDFLLTIVPENPQAGGQVVATLQSYSTDINELLISWSYDGKIIDSGIGRRSVTVAAGTIGERKTLEATVQISGSAAIRKSVVIAPANIDLLWESLDASVPPFYKGKPLVPSEGIVRVSAFPDRATKARSSIYGWSKDGSIVEQGSGYGKIGFIYKNSYLNTTNTIGASIRRADGIITEDAILVATVHPTLIFYKKTAGFTDYATALAGSYQMRNNTETVVAEPLYFSILKPLEQVLNITWSLNRQNATEGDRPNELVVNRGNNQGTARVQASVKNKSMLTQFSENSFELNF